MKLANTSAAIMYSSIKSGHSCGIPPIRVQGSNSRPFLLILDWILVNATFNDVNEFVYISELLQSRKEKIPINSIKGFWII